MMYSRALTKHSITTIRRFSSERITTTKTQINVPFQTHLTSATHRYREEASLDHTSTTSSNNDTTNKPISDRKEMKEAPTPGRLSRKTAQIYDYDETILENNDIFAVGGRLLRNKNHRQIDTAIGGSLAVSNTSNHSSFQF